MDPSNPSTDVGVALKTSSASSTVRSLGTPKRRPVSELLWSVEKLYALLSFSPPEV